MSDTIREALLLGRKFIELVEEDLQRDCSKSLKQIDKALALLPQSPEGMVMVPRRADYGLIEELYDTRDWEGEDYRMAQRNYARWVEKITAYVAVSSHSQEEEMGDT